ncbi:MAG: hypothetical protein RL215_1495 [Planctomycetota bacterium]
MGQHESPAALPCSFGSSAVAGDFAGGSFFSTEGFEAFDLVFGEDGVDAFFNICEFAALCESDKGDSAALLIGGESSGASDAVDVVVAEFGDIVVDDV